MNSPPAFSLSEVSSDVYASRCCLSGNSPPLKTIYSSAKVSTLAVSFHKTHPKLSFLIAKDSPLWLWGVLSLGHSYLKTQTKLSCCPSNNKVLFWWQWSTLGFWRNPQLCTLTPSSLPNCPSGTTTQWSSWFLLSCLLPTDHPATIKPTEREASLSASHHL